MNQNQLLKQMIEFNKTAFENTFSMMAMFQERAEATTNECLNQTPWLPKEGRAVVDQWAKACKNGRECFKNSIDESFKKAEAFFADSPKGE